MATKKKTLFEEIESIHDKAKQMKEELKDVGLDDMIEEQERMVIAAQINNVFWRAIV